MIDSSLEDIQTRIKTYFSISIFQILFLLFLRWFLRKQTNRNNLQLILQSNMAITNCLGWTSQISLLYIIALNIHCYITWIWERKNGKKFVCYSREFVITEFDCRFIFKKIDSALYCWYIYVKKYFSWCIYYFLVISIQILVWSVLLKLCHKK